MKDNKEFVEHIVKALAFVDHIEKHIAEMKIEGIEGKVACKICGKDIDEIYNGGGTEQ